jgi:hypothetical protein
MMISMSSCGMTLVARQLISSTPRSPGA